MLRARWPAFVAVSLLLIYASTLAWTYHVVVKLGRYRDEIGALRIATFDALQLQLDEETGLRGYVDTGDARFLEPLRAAALTIDRPLADLAVVVEPFVADSHSRDLEAVCADEGRTHQLWWRTVAQPLLAKRTRTDARALQLRGKNLIDRFRADSSVLNGLLTAESVHADVVRRRDLASIVILGLIGSALLLLVSSFVARRSERSWLDGERQRLLYENEKRIADTLQAAFLQPALPTLPDVRFDAVYVSAGDAALVGGDWYEALTLPDGRVFLSVGDVTGHGIEAAVTMGRVRQALITTALRESDPAAVLEHVNSTLLLQGENMVSAVCGFLEVGKREFTYATAGHPPAIIAAPGAVARSLEAGGPPLGVVPAARYERFACIAEDGAMLVLYTDGLIEYGRDAAAGEQRLLGIVSRVARLPGTGHPARAIFDAVFAGSMPADDVAILVVSLRGGSASL